MNKNLYRKQLTLRSVSLAITLGLILITGIENSAALSNCQSEPTHPNPALSTAYGKSLTEWMMLHSAWYNQGQDPLLGTIGHVTLIPLPQQLPTPIPPDLPAVDSFKSGSLNITLKPGSPFVVPVISLSGELYVNDILPPDDLSPYKSSLLNADILVTLDGKTIMQSPADNHKFFYGPAYFPEPIAYNPPQFRFNDPVLGDVYAAAISSSMGIGFVHPPLSVGKHTLKLHAVNSDLGYGFANTWNITVKPEGKKNDGHKPHYQ